MNIRPKTVRRLLVLFLALMLFSGGIVTWLALSQRSIRAQIARQRQDAIAAFEAKDYASAVQLFSSYIVRSNSQDSDAEAVFDYAKVRMNTSSEGGRHVFEAIGLFERYLELSIANDPRGPQRRAVEENEARHLLLNLYTQAHYTKEARDRANKLLAANPNDEDALRNLIRASQSDDSVGALVACRKLNQLVPDDLEWQITELRLMNGTGQPSAQLVARARDLQARNPNSATFQALASWADLVYGNDPDGAKKSIEAAAALRPAKPETVLQIVRLLDLQQDFSQADELLEKARAANPASVQVLRSLLGRTWERQRPAEVVRVAGAVDPKIADTTVLGYLAMALFDSNRGAEAAPLLDALDSRKDDVSRAWTIAIKTLYSKERLAPKAALHAYGEAVLRDPANPVFPYFLGEVWNSIGEVDQAMRAWTDAGQKSPSWALPYCSISRSLSASGRFPEALRAAELARQRAPGTHLVESCYARAWYGMEYSGGVAKTAVAKESDALFALLENIQKSWKNDPETLTQFVSMLARRGQRDRAKDVLHSAAIAEPALGVQTLIQLSSVSHFEHLGVEGDLLDRAEKLQGLSAPIALAKAVLLAEAGNRSQALTWFDGVAKAHVADVEWRLSGARLHDALLDDEAANQWKAIGNEFANNVQVQYAVLQSRTGRTDRAFWRQTIDRLKALTGPEGQAWQLEDARWRLAGTPNESEITAVIASLEKVAAASKSAPEVHRLLAEAMLRSNSADGVSRATAELSTAHDLKPGDFETTSKLVQVLISQGMRDRAGALADDVVGSGELPIERRLWAAGVYGDLGRADAAISLVGGAEAGAAGNGVPAGFLAKLYHRAGREADAAALYQKILADPNAAADALVEGAEFFATEKPEISEQFLGRLEKASFKPGALAVLRSRIQQVSGQPDKAIATLEAASKEYPQVQQVWQELSGAYLRAGKLDDADRAAGDGVKSIPGSAGLAGMRKQIARLRLLSPQEAGGLLEVVSHDPLQPVADQALALLADAKTHGTPAAQATASLGELAVKNARFLPLQKLVAQRYASGGRLKDAAEIAARISAANPQDIDAARLQCAIQTALGDWDGAKQSALRWRRLTGTNPLDADLAIARSDIEQSKPDPAGAIAQLAAYVGDNAAVTARQAALPLYCAALVKAGRSADAVALLEPLLAGSPKWQKLWLELGASVQKDPAGASSWLQKFSELSSPATPREKAALAEAWEQVGNRFDLPTAHESARAILEPVIAGNDVPAEAWPTWASINQAADNLPETERAWRAYIKARPDQPLAKNNLAYILMLQGRPAQLAEAEGLSRAAITAEPGVSTLYDTLARIQLREGKTDDALKSFRAALDRNASNVDAMIGLADALQPRPQDRDEVKSLLNRIDAAMRQGAPIASPIRRQLDRVKSALSSSSL